MDDFDRFWQWANKPTHSRLTIPADLHHAVTSLPPLARRDRARVNEAVRKIQEGTGSSICQGVHTMGRAPRLRSPLRRGHETSNGTGTMSERADWKFLLG
jgi:hypothetical protein